MNEQKYDTQLLKSSKLTNVLFNEVIKLPLSNIELIYLSSNQSLNQQQIEYMFSLKVDNVNINLLRNQYCPKNIIDEFLLLNDKIYNIAIAHNENLSKEQINQLLKLNDDDVNLSLKFNNLL